MKSKPYELHGKLFRYDFDRSVVEYVAKAGAEEIADNAEWMQKYGRPLFDVDGDGCMTLGAVGLRRENWENKATRDEYLSGWCSDLEEESAALVADFVKYELPHMNAAGKE